MPSIQIKPRIQIDLQAIVEGLSDLDTPTLEAFVEKVNLLLAQRKSSSLTQEETQLLLQINQGISIEVLDRFYAIQKKQRESALSTDEQSEMEELVKEIENVEAKRLESMISLAGLWEITVDELKERLGINAPDPHVW